MSSFREKKIKKKTLRKMIAKWPKKRGYISRPGGSIHRFARLGRREGSRILKRASRDRTKRRSQENRLEIRESNTQLGRVGARCGSTYLFIYLSIYLSIYLYFCLHFYRPPALLERFNIRSFCVIRSLTDPFFRFFVSLYSRTSSS